MNRPVFFISSTIEDFRDLRSALKYYLEEQGCTVLASEYNDFNKPVDRTITDACIEALKKAQYYILLIGGRVGSWYDEESRISISRHEYHEAYKLHKEGKIKLLLFVRNEIWLFRKERMALKKSLSGLELNQKLREQIELFPTDVISNPVDIISFIDEVCRLSDGSSALSNQTGNWVHRFNEFRDVIDVVHTQVFLGDPIEHIALKRILTTELTKLLKGSLIKEDNGKLTSIKDVLETFKKQLPKKIEVEYESKTEVNFKAWDQLLFYAFHVFKVQFNSIVVEHALKSSVFLEFDIKSDGFKEDLIYDWLSQLHSELLNFNFLRSSKSTDILFTYSRRGRSMPDENFYINSGELLSILSLLTSWSNITELLTSILRLLKRIAVYGPRLTSVLADIRKVPSDPQATDEEIDRWLSYW